MAAVSLPTGVIVAGIPLAIVAVTLAADLARRRAWTRERWLLGHDFALAAVALAVLDGLLWIRQYLLAVQEAAGRPPAPLDAVLEPAGRSLVLVLAMLAFAALIALALHHHPWAPTAGRPPMSYARIAVINAIGLLPLVLASLLFAELD